MHVTPLIDDGHGIGGRPHLTGPRNVIRTGHVVPQPVIQCRIGGQFGIGGRDPLLQNRLQSRIIQEPHTQAHGLAQALQVPGIVQIPILHGRWHGRVSGGEPQFASADGQI